MTSRKWPPSLAFVEAVLFWWPSDLVCLVFEYHLPHGLLSQPWRVWSVGVECERVVVPLVSVEESPESVDVVTESGENLKATPPFVAVPYLFPIAPGPSPGGRGESKRALLWQRTNLIVVETRMSPKGKSFWKALSEMGHGSEYWHSVWKVEGALLAQTASAIHRISVSSEGRVELTCIVPPGTFYWPRAFSLSRGKYYDACVTSAAGLWFCLQSGAESGADEHPEVQKGSENMNKEKKTWSKLLVLEQDQKEMVVVQEFKCFLPGDLFSLRIAVDAEGMIQVWQGRAAVPPLKEQQMSRLIFGVVSRGNARRVLELDE